ncbi:MAG: hypothetical protein BWY15_00978 [Firmicutes bacterium ADurb.Bin193]|nr:MAG: hypothetical protein BWY15_00978 [Firmicutes bacterium ADurb.Bin193]
MMRVIIIGLLVAIMLFAVSSCGIAPRGNIEPTPTSTQASTKIKYIVHDRNCALKLGEGIVTDLSFRRIENPWKNSSRVPVKMPVIKASCGCFEREYPDT